MVGRCASVSGLIVGSIFVARLCSTTASAMQGPLPPAPAPAATQSEPEVKSYGGTKTPGFLLPIERALKRILRRTAGDRTLKPLAGATIERIDFPNAKGAIQGYSFRTGATTGDQIEIPTNGNPASVKVEGSLGLRIDYDPIENDGVGTDIQALGGLYNGSVSWQTDDPKVVVEIGWLTKDSDAPDRLLAIVREELQREGLRLVPHEKTDWPAATPPERLARLLPLDPAPPATPRSKSVAASPQGRARVFLTPNDVVAARNRAVADKDWEAYARCLTPGTQAALIGEVLFLAEMGGKKCPGLIETIEKHIKVKLFDASKSPASNVHSKEAQEFFSSLEKPPGERDGSAETWVYEVFRNRVGDVPTFLADCFRQLPGPPEGVGKIIECGGIRIEGDKAAGYWIDRRPAPSPEEVEKHSNSYYLPRYFPMRFQRIGGSWLIL